MPPTWPPPTARTSAVPACPPNPRLSLGRGWGARPPGVVCAPLQLWGVWAWTGSCPPRLEEGATPGPAAPQMGL